MNRLPNLATVASALLIVLAAGCQQVQWISAKAPEEQIDKRYIPVDEATRVRNWSQSVAYTPDQDTVAGPLGFPWEPVPHIDPYLSGIVVETPLFMLNCCAAPISLIIMPPLTVVRWSPGDIAASYTAMPPPEVPPGGQHAANGYEVPYHTTGAYPTTQPAGN